MESNERILVIFLSVALATFLVLAIIAIVKTIQVLNNLRRISEKMSNLADSAGSIGEFLKKAAGPLAVGRIITNVIKQKRSGGKRRRDG